MGDLKRELIGLSDYAFGRLMGRLEGLTDDEYLWEPASGCWTLSPTGTGGFRPDQGLIMEADPPVTTIGWRVHHVVGCLAAPRCATWIGLEPRAETPWQEFPGTASEALERLRLANEMWRSYLDAVAEPDLWTQMGPIAGQYQDETRVAFVLHILDELIHHGAEIGLLRDLYRAERTYDPFVDACLRADRDAVEAMRRDDPEALPRVLGAQPRLTLRAAEEGRWDAIPLLLEIGFSIAESGGRTPLHHAAAAGALETMRLLIEMGADPNISDDEYHATPQGWAEYFGRTEAADYLRSLTTSPA